MKPKDLIMLLVAASIFLVAGFLAYTQLSPKKSTGPKVVNVEVVGPIGNTLDSSALTTLQSSSIQDFDSPVDLSGLNNTTPFGQ